MRLGPGAILAMALGAAAKEQLDVALPCYGLSSGQLWRRSVAAALAIECAQRHGCGTPPPEAFAAALLRDIGILVLAGQMQPDVLEMLDRSRSEGGRSLTESEMEILGVHHGEVGALIARHWELPELIAEAIAFHHAPDEAPTEEGRGSAWFVALADAVTQALERPAPERNDVSSALLMRMGLSIGQFSQFVQDVESRLEEVLSRYD
jgi:HD-like signal output (HDOD) protein